jgi:flavin-binding protein dodecin
MTVVKWAWRKFVLTAQTFDSLEEAIEDAVHAADMGDESLDSIEVIEDGVIRLYGWGSPEVKTIADAIRADEYAEFKAFADVPRWTILLEHVKERKWVPLLSFAEEDDAASYAADLQHDAGAARVRIEAPA